MGGSDLALRPPVDNQCYGAYPLLASIVVALVGVLEVQQ